MSGISGSISGNNFYMGMQNGSKLEIWMFFIHSFKLNQSYTPLECRVSPICLYREALHLQGLLKNFFCLLLAYLNYPTETNSFLDCALQIWATTAKSNNEAHCAHFYHVYNPDPIRYKIVDVILLVLVIKTKV